MEEVDQENLAPHITIARMRPKSSTQPRGGQPLASVEADTEHTGHAYANYPRDKLDLMAKFRKKLQKKDISVDQAIKTFDPKNCNCVTQGEFLKHAKTMKIDLTSDELASIFYFISGEDSQARNSDDTINWFDSEFRRAFAAIADNYHSKGSKKRYDSRKTNKSNKKKSERRSSTGGMSERRSTKSRPVSGKSRTITVQSK